MSLEKKIRRHPQNPVIEKNHVNPSLQGLEVIGVFNPAACQLGDEIILLMRVAEACIPEKGRIQVPVMNMEGEPRLEILTWKSDGEQEMDTSDPRKYVIDGKMYLSSISHLRIARSKDGVHFIVDQNPFLAPGTLDEKYGVEDARITRLGDAYYITYTAVSDDGFGVNLVSTTDFVELKRHGMIFPPQNKDSCIFPEKIQNRYMALHRPITEFLGKPSIWYAESHDLLYWGNHSCLLRPRNNRWENEKIGAGPQPIRTEQGWLVLYHGCGYDSVYSLYLCLLDLGDPRKVIKRGKTPILVPEEECEKHGFFPNVVFSNGWVEKADGSVQIYYGAADESICLAETTLDDLLAMLDQE